MRLYSKSFYAMLLKMISMIMISMMIMMMIAVDNRYYFTACSTN